MINTWLTEDRRIHLPNVFEYLGYRNTGSFPKYHIYEGKGNSYCILLTDAGFYYYKVQHPEVKLSASDLIIEYVSKLEGKNKESVWDKVDNFYRKVLETDSLMIGSKALRLEIVPKQFNHFESYRLLLSSFRDDFYDQAMDYAPFNNRIFENNSGDALFPLYNLQNENCGYFSDDTHGISLYKESSHKNSLWYSNIPDTIDWLLVFKDPKEALAFHKKFQLKHVVYIALGSINYETTKILFQIQQSTKVKKLILTFTGQKKIEGYLRDLHFISLMDRSNFNLTVREHDILVDFRLGQEKSFLKFFNSTKTFNQSLAKSFLKYNKIIDQNKINTQSIIVAKEDELIKVRLPLEANAIKFFVWSYFKNYLNKTIDILKPVQSNWYLEWESTQSISVKGKEVAWKDYRIAL